MKIVKIPNQNKTITLRIEAIGLEDMENFKSVVDQEIEKVKANYVIIEVIEEVKLADFGKIAYIHYK